MSPQTQTVAASKAASANSETAAARFNNGMLLTASLVNHVVGQTLNSRFAVVSANLEFEKHTLRKRSIFLICRDDHRIPAGGKALTGYRMLELIELDGSLTRRRKHPFVVAEHLSPPGHSLCKKLTERSNRS